jgi:hypothetical protein
MWQMTVRRGAIPPEPLQWSSVRAKSVLRKWNGCFGAPMGRGGGGTAIELRPRVAHTHMRHVRTTKSKRQAMCAHHRRVCTVAKMAIDALRRNGAAL